MLCLIQGPRSYQVEKTPEFVQEKRQEILSKFQDPAHAELLMSYVAGDYKRLPQEVKEAHKILGLNHLFTPSGIHLSALFILFFPLLFWLKKVHRPGHLAFGTLLYLLPFFILPTFYAAKRISLLRLISLWKTVLPFEIPFFALFLLAFALDFFLGGYAASPGSFVYSFLFIGILFSCDKSPGLFIPFALLGGQVIVSYFQETPLTLIGFLLGFFLTTLFTPFFPIYFFYFWTSSFFPASWGEFFIKCYWKLVLYSAQLAQSSGQYFVSLPLILLVIVLSLRLPYRLKVLIIALCFSLQSQPLLNARKAKDLRSKKIMLYGPPCKKTRAKSPKKEIFHEAVNPFTSIAKSPASLYV